MRPVRVLIAAGAAVALTLSISLSPASAAPAPAASAAQSPPSRWIVVVAPGLGLSRWPEPVFSDLADRGVVGLMPASHAADAVARLRAAGAPLLHVRSARDLGQLVEWASAPATSVGVPSVVIVDVGDPAAAGRARAQDVEQVAAVLEASPRLGIAVVSPEPGGNAQSLTPVVVAGVPAGPIGMPVSSSTRREGIAASDDILGAVAGPPSVAPAFGAPALTGASLKTRLTILEGVRARVGATDATRRSVTEAWLTVLLALLVTGEAAAAFGEPGGRLRRAAAFAQLVPLAVPLAGYVVALALPTAVTPAALGATVAGVSALVALAAVAAGLRFGPSRAAAGLLGLTAAVVVADQIVGAPLLFANVFSYSLAAGGRFYGLGNEGAGLLLGSVCTAFALVAPRAGERGAVRTASWAGAVFATAFVVCIAPWWGANIGVSVWGSVLLLVAWSGLLPAGASKAPVWVAALLAALATLTFVALDAVVGLTHIGRAVRKVVASGAPALWAILGERGSTAARTLAGEPWTVALLGILVALALVRFLPPPPVRELFSRRPALRALCTASFAASVVALAVEDTGSTVAAYLVALALVAVLLRLLEPEDEAPAGPRERLPEADAPEGSGP